MGDIPLEEPLTQKRSGTDCVFPNAQPCGARTRAGGRCRLPAELNEKSGLRKRCKRHGGKSTGPKTPTATHGRYTKAYRETKRAIRKKLDNFKQDVADVLFREDSL